MPNNGHIQANKAWNPIYLKIDLKACNIHDIARLRHLRWAAPDVGAISNGWTFPIAPKEHDNGTCQESRSHPSKKTRLKQIHHKTRCKGCA
jgi:hypothetical protein